MQPFAVAVALEVGRVARRPRRLDEEHAIETPESAEQIRARRGTIPVEMRQADEVGRVERQRDGVVAVVNRMYHARNQALCICRHTDTPSLLRG